MAYFCQYILVADILSIDHNPPLISLVLFADSGIKWANAGLFLYLFSLFSVNIEQKNISVIRIRTQINNLRVEYPNHYTHTITAPGSYFLQLSRQCKCISLLSPICTPNQLAHFIIPMEHHVFQFATRGQCIKGKKLDCFEHKHIFCFKLQCANIAVLLCTAIWWKSNYAVVHWSDFLIIGLFLQEIW